MPSLIQQIVKVKTAVLSAVTLPLRWQNQLIKRQAALQSLLLSHSADDLLVGNYYLRTGMCTQCGKCCESIHLGHKGRYIQNTWHFNWLKCWFREYRHFTPIGTTDDGLVFKCNALREDKTCSVYGERPTFCRRYPTEAVMIMGKTLPEECGYVFKPIETFEQTLQEMNT
jgi:Fe-S-cluster containining protein